jgi:hypothetical protein
MRSVEEEEGGSNEHCFVGRKYARLVGTKRNPKK